MNSRKKRFVNPIKIEVTRRARTETILGKSPAICNGHQPPRADDPYAYFWVRKMFIVVSKISLHIFLPSLMLGKCQILTLFVSIVPYNLLKGFYSNYHQNKSEEEKD